MSDFTITVIDTASGVTEALPLDPSTLVSDVIGFAQAILGLSGSQAGQLLKNGKPLDPTCSLKNAGVVHGDMLVIRNVSSSSNQDRAPAVASGTTTTTTASTGATSTSVGGLDFSNLLNPTTQPSSSNTSRSVVPAGGLDFSTLWNHPTAV